MKSSSIQLLVFFIGFACLTGCNSTKRAVQTSTEEKVIQTSNKDPLTKEKPIIKIDSVVVEETALPVPVSETKGVKKEADTLEVNLHSTWNSLLQKNVSEDGFVNYQGFKKDRKPFNEYLQLLEDNVPDSSTSREEKLAYWINAYNAFTVKLILDNYPVNSIKDIKNPWDIRFFKLGNKWYNLNEIEHQILRKMNEPRIHFAIVCASVSCPKLQNEAFIAEDLEIQLNDATRTFLNDPTKNKIDGQKAVLSLIFRWFSKDFKKQGSIIDFIEPYVETPVNDQTKISYLKYDWGLNGA
ncbi:DUF547 domain-containing protein [Flavobacteriaceae bacterium M23B6Z8]